jgi:Protein of unknown function (DUF3373)
MSIRKKTIVSILWMVVVIAMGLATLFAAVSHAADEELQKKVEALSKEVESLKRQTAESRPAAAPGKSLSDWLTIGGDYRFRADSLRGEVADHFPFTGFDPATGNPVIGALQPSFKVKNDTMFTNRLGLNLKAKVVRNVSLNVRLLMYKTFGSQDDSAVTGLQTFDPAGNRVVTPFFADRVGVFDGTIGHIPDSSLLNVDQAYVTWTNILDQPIWFSVGRRPSTGGVPSHLRQNNERPGTGGIPALLVDYAFDGASLGIAPDIDALPGSYAKLCYGRGFENGITKTQGNGMRDTEFIGFSVTPYDTDRLMVNLQWDRGFNIFDSPVIDGKTLFGAPIEPRVDLGEIDWYGITLLSAMKNVGPGTLNLFAAGAVSITHPNDNRTMKTPAFPGVGLLLNPGESKEDKTGEAVYVGARYDFNKDRTKVGVEYNYGTKNWIGFVPAGDDMWTSKLGVRGSVYEAYVIQELNLPVVASYLSKTFFRLGYQYYDFQYTGSNGWVGAPGKISELAASPNNAQIFIPLKSAHDIYATMEVKF